MSRKEWVLTILGCAAYLSAIAAVFHFVTTWPW